MARSRNIKPGFFKNEDLAECSFPARLCFAGLWLLADREGRLEDRPKRIKGDLFAYDSIEIEPLLQELIATKFIVRYEIDGHRYIEVPTFKDHQTPHYSEKASAIPARDSRSGAAIKPAALPDDSGKEAPSRGGRNLLIPDSLIPDSLIPDSLSSAGADSSPAKLPTDPGEVKKPKKDKLSKTPTIPCPYANLIALYHEKLPELPPVRLDSEARHVAMRKLWGFALSSRKTDGSRRAETAEQALHWVGTYFERARENDFLMGRGKRSEEHAHWRCDFDFLLTERGMKQVIEKTAPPPASDEASG